MRRTTGNTSAGHWRTEGWITEEDVDDVVGGAVVLGSGGGGDPYLPRQMLRAALRRHGPVRLVDAADLPPDSLVLPVLSAGTPSVLVEMFHGEQESARLRTLFETVAEGSCSAVLPVQLGAVNVIAPVVTAAQLGLPCVDADVMRRCLPMIEATLLTLAGLSASPVVVVDSRGTSAVLSADDAGTVSRLLRSAMPHMGLVALISTYRLTAAECARLAPRGGLTECVRIGRALRSAPVVGDPAALLAETGGRLLFSGVVRELVHRTTDGFPRGVVSIESDPPADRRGARMMRVDFQNENLVASADGVVAVTVPDVIDLIDRDTGAVLQTVDVVVGQQVHVVALPVDERWHRPDGYALAGPRAFGLDVDPVRVGPS
ncbi:DUF917 domain-containing protein [Pseudonocardia kongjuensis]|uniref:DUF917 domain-containing protein n=1 Tax=Pseudonocardia kongjuensis TaxID=102227 RepID=A0ABP4I6R4_9PSEU